MLCGILHLRLQAFDPVDFLIIGKQGSQLAAADRRVLLEKDLAPGHGAELLQVPFQLPPLVINVDGCQEVRVRIRKADVPARIVADLKYRR